MKSGSQRAARAFAAELLAPLGYVQSRVTRSTVTQGQLTTTAANAGALPLVVRHQIENHRLASSPRRRGATGPAWSAIRRSSTRRGRPPSKSAQAPRDLALVCTRCAVRYSQVRMCR